LSLASIAAEQHLSRDVPRPLIHVVAAAVIDAAGRVLIAQRPEGKHLAGGWEFPGGKLEAGEERIAGLARELHEELGITITAGLARPLIRVSHAYPTREVLLDYRGEPQGLDGQALRWCAQDELATADLLPADKPIVAALRLPERLTESSTPYYEIDADVSGSDSFERRTRGADAAGSIRLRGVFCASAAEAAAAGGVGADFLVMKDALVARELEALCGSVPVPVYARGMQLEQAWMLGASGLNEIWT
jgi:mutator protein MutT